MKIAFLLPANFIGGGVFFIFEHAKRLFNKGHKITIIFADSNSPLEINFYPGMDLIETIHLDDISTSEVFDFVFATSWITAYFVSSLKSKYYCYMVQDNERNFLLSHQILDEIFIEKTYIENFTFFCTTHWLSDMIEEFGNHAIVVPYSIDFSLFHKAALDRQHESKLRILVEGRGGEPRKRIDFTFQVLKNIKDIAVVYISSDGVKREEWVVDEYHEKVSHHDMPTLYASCDLILKLSSQESFSLPVLETFATGGTAIVSAFSGHDEYIRHNYNALVVPIDDKEAAIAAIERVRDDETLLLSLKLGAKRTCESRVTWEHSSNILERHLSGMMENENTPELMVMKRYRPALDEVIQNRNINEKMEELLSSKSFKLGNNIRLVVTKIRFYIRFSVRKPWKLLEQLRLR